MVDKPKVVITRRLPGVSLAKNVDGLIVTVPHKFAVLPLCSDTTPQARSIGAVNVMRRDASGAWFG